MTIIRWIMLFLCLPHLAYAMPLVADLSQYRIEIDSSFNGTRLLLFGARNDIGDIVVVVRGPSKQFIVRKKERIAGIWVNRDAARFNDVPLYYNIASSKPFDKMVFTDSFSPLQIGFLEAVTGKNDHSIDADILPYADAFIDYARSHQLYGDAASRVSFMGESLFKLVLPFPDNIPGGNYSVNVYLFRDGTLTGMQSIPLTVEKIGFDAFVYNFAHQHSVIYGCLAVLLALGMGWSASSLFRKI